MIHSAGIFIKSRGDVVDIQESLDWRMRWGEKTPNEVALAALFDNGLFNYPYKEKVKQSVSRHKSRGLTHKSFTDYDYIIIFSHQHKTKMEQLKAAMHIRQRKQAVNESKGKMILLGEYGAGKSADIWEPRTDGEAKTQKREDWKRTVSTIKVAFKSFLKKELGWVQPPPRAEQ